MDAKRSVYLRRHGREGLPKVLTPDIKDKALWLVILLPGFVTIGTARLTSNLPGLSDFQLGVLYFVVSTANAAISLALAQAILWWRQRAMSLQDLARSLPFVAVLLVISICNGILLAVAYENAWVNRTVQSVFGINILPLESPHSAIERLLRTTNSTEDFDDRRSTSAKRDIKVLRIHLDKTGPVLGRAARWSSTDGHLQLYISPACTEESGQAIPIAGPGIWIALKNVVRIDFLDLRSVSCVNHLMPQRGEAVPKIPW